MLDSGLNDSDKMKCRKEVEMTILIGSQSDAYILHAVSHSIWSLPNTYTKIIIKNNHGGGGGRQNIMVFSEEFEFLY